jgi:hypothetical protein
VVEARKLDLSMQGDCGLVLNDPTLRIWVYAEIEADLVSMIVGIG